MPEPPASYLNLDHIPRAYVSIVAIDELMYYSNNTHQCGIHIHPN